MNEYIKEQLQILKERQSLSLDDKIKISKSRIIEFKEHFNGQVYNSFSGGVDSLVSRHLVNSIYPNIKSVFANTGLEYPEIVEFVKSFKDVIIVRPKQTYAYVCKNIGYPIISKKVSHMLGYCQNPNNRNTATYILNTTGIKRNGEKTKMFKIPDKYMYLLNAPFKISDKCCDLIKKEPLHRYTKENKCFPFMGILAEDSQIRELQYCKYHCNAFTSKSPYSNPLGFWTNKDIWEYIGRFGLEYCKIYDMGVKHTGCMFCMFGVHLEKGLNRFQLMNKTHPKLYNYCINNLGLGKCLDYIGVKY